MEKLVRYFIENRAVTYLTVFIMFVGGLASFFMLGQLEDPVFSIKTAVITTRYPGASPEEVELEVTDPLEQAIQEMPQLKEMYSTSSAGVSVIKVDIKDRYWSNELPQIWDELRKKIRDRAKQLPPGVEEPLVLDDFGFVYGFLLTMTGDGFSPRELEQYADTVKKELGLVEGITRVELWGVQPQVIYVDLSETKLQQLGVSAQTMVETLSQQNLIVEAGHVDLDTMRLRIEPSGEFTDPVDIGELNIKPSTLDVMSQLVSPSGHLLGQSDLGFQKVQDLTAEGVEDSVDILLLKDIATVRRGYQEPSATIMRRDGKPAIAIALAGADDENIVTVGRRLEQRLEEVKEFLPVGLQFEKVAWQSDIVSESVNAFLINLAQAVAIVLIVLIIPSGMRMGFIIGFDLLITILATFIFMFLCDIPLQRMSLGALIIAMGMMVDNAIVVSDSMAVKIRNGVDRVQAAVEACTSSAYPLLSATFVAVMAFYPIYASTASAGEYCNTLFTVIAAALIISWLVAMFITPVQCIDMLPEPEKKDPGSSGGEFDTPFYQKFRKVLKKLIRFRGLTMACLVAMLVVSIFSFGFVRQMFFPDSSRPQIMLDYWAPEGTRIGKVSEDLKVLEKKILENPLVESINTFVGAGPPRFYLPVDPEGSNSSYGQIIVNFHDYRTIDRFIAETEPWSTEQFPEAMIRYRKYAVGPGNTWKFEARFSGPAHADFQELRQIGEDVARLTAQSPYGMDWRLDMRNRTLKLVPEYDQKRARLSSISRRDIANTTRRGYDGMPVGIYRERDKILPIVVRHEKGDRKEMLDRIQLLQVQPTFTTKTIPYAQAVDGVDLKWEDPIIVRYNRRRAVTVQGGPKEGETFATLKSDVVDKIDSVPLPKGYEMMWDGEEKSSREAQESLIPGMVPAFVIILFSIITVFNAYRPFFIIVMTIPFAVIGVTWGLLILDTPFGFLALLGAMSLAGMMNKNIVVLLDACQENLANGMSQYEAIIEASVTRVRPVLLAAATTVLGVIPLVTDIFWTAMAVTIMAGLAFGSILTLVVVPVLYTILYRVKSDA